MMYLAWIAALVVAVAHSQGSPNSLEYGRVGTVYKKNNNNLGAIGHDNRLRDLRQQDGHFNRNAVWTGRAGEKDDAYRRNQQQFRDQAAARHQNYGRNNNNFGNIVQQIRDEGLRNSYKINEAAKYHRNDQDQANGYNAANAKKNAFDRGNKLDDNIDYRFNKRFDKESSESGGYEDEKGRRYSKLDLIDEKEKDRALKRTDNGVSRKQNDQQQAIKESDWRANANQAQAQGGQFGFGDRRLEAAGERSDDRAINYNRKDNQFRENEKGVDSAIRLAKDLAEQAAGYRNEAGANADSLRNVNDKKYYGGGETGGHIHPGYNAPYGSGGVRGPKRRNEGSGGGLHSGFTENADQTERAEELARATALSAADARNEYERLKDRVVYDEVKGLKDRAQGAFKQGLSDSTSQGYSKNGAEAAKHANESDKKFAGRASVSDFVAKQNSLNEALRDRDYYLKKQNDENETFTKRKQFFHNKKGGGTNDEVLKYNRKKQQREFGAAEEADLAKQDQYARSHQDAKVAANERNFEDTNNRKAQSHIQRDDRIQSAEGSASGREEEAARAGSLANAFEKRNNWHTADDSRSEELLKNQVVWDANQIKKNLDQDSGKHSKDVKADVESLVTGGQSPFRNLRADDVVGDGVLGTLSLGKQKKEHTIPDIQIDISPVRQKLTVEPPKERLQIDNLPSIEPVKAYRPPKYNKKEVDYSTKIGQPSRSRTIDQRIPQHGGFQRINPNLFNRDNSAFSRLNTNLLDTQRGRGSATNAFRKPVLAYSTRGRTSLGSIARQPRTNSFAGFH